MKAIIFFSLQLLTGLSLLAQEQTFIKEYTYKASEVDSKISCRAIAINQLRSLLLNEIGVYVESKSILSTTDVNGKFAQDFEENITTISAGITKLETLDEKWDGESFWMKAKMTVDQKQLEESLKELSNDRKKVKELEEIKQQLSNATNELDRIRQVLKSNANQKVSESLTERYNSQIKILSSSDYFLNGREKMNRGDFTGAIEDYTKSIELESQHNQSYGDRGLAKYELSLYGEAILDFNAALQSYPEFADAYYSLRGVAKASLKDYRGSIEDFNKAFALDPKFAEVVSNRAVSKSLLLDYQGALDDYAIAIKIDPKFSPAYFKRGILRIIHLNQKESGCLDLSKAGELGDSNAYEAIKDLCK